MQKLQVKWLIKRFKTVISNGLKLVLMSFLISVSLAYGAKLSNKDVVNVKDYIPNIYIDLKYATKDNFTGEKIYDFYDAYLRYGTVKKLMTVQKELNKLGYSLKIWDAYRPVEAQFKLWDAVGHDSRFVVNPTKYYSPHSLGNTVDITMVTIDGQEIEMPTEFDTFNEKADRNYNDLSPIQRKNALILENAMKNVGFQGYRREWWHYKDSVKYPVIKNFPNTKKSSVSENKSKEKESKNYIELKKTI
ncbi:M15 family metallopeptidase [Fusobacterium sp. PH5-44]|uniref:M15 family metallopeptidase n=1 Tax=unclassified Fusobacterium TaxID=2648384 RepID=UPI003D20B248